MFLNESTWKQKSMIILHLHWITAAFVKHINAVFFFYIYVHFVHYKGTNSAFDMFSPAFTLISLEHQRSCGVIQMQNKWVHIVFTGRQADQICMISTVRGTISGLSQSRVWENVWLFAHNQQSTNNQWKHERSRLMSLCTNWNCMRKWITLKRTC